MTKQLSDFRFTVNPETTASVHDDGIVILHIGNGRLYASNGMGARIWRGVEQQLSVVAIAEEVSGDQAITQTSAREQVVHFLEELEQHGLVQRKAEL